MALPGIQRRLEEQAQSPAFRNYLHLRPLILEMMGEIESATDCPSDYWDEELNGFEYLLDATPLVIGSLRQHCYHITGLRSYEYRRHHAHMRGAFKAKLNALKALDKKGLFVSEAPEMGGFGHEIKGGLVNLDTLKFYESLIVMNQGGLLDQLKPADAGKAAIIEIGAGWGGFAYQIKKLFPEVCYVIIDLPQTLLISSVYLKSLFPHAKSLMYGESGFESSLKNFRAFDFVFLPHYVVPQADLPGVELAINMVSFQEMTITQVECYLEWLARMKCPAIYSHNRDRSKHNAQMNSVSSLLQRYFDLQEFRPLPVPYTVLALPQKPKFKRPKTLNAKTWVRELMRYYLKATEEKTVNETDYRHFIGRLKNA